jgi:hypothetical protein
MIELKRDSFSITVAPPSLTMSSRDKSLRVNTWLGGNFWFLCLYITLRFDSNDLKLLAISYKKFLIFNVRKP